MRKIIFFILFMLNTTFSFSQECSPTFKQIYNFKMGDYFEYEKNDYFSVADYDYIVHENEKYFISGTIQDNDSIYYKRLGVVTSQTIERIGGDYDTTTTKTLIEDSVLLVDSADHFLNQCDGALVDVYLFNKFSDVLPNSGYYTSIKIEQEDNLLKKSAGENKYVADSSGMITDTLDFFEAGYDNFYISYAPGLGMTEYTYQAQSVEPFIYRAGDKVLKDYFKVSGICGLNKPVITNGDTVEVCLGASVVLRTKKSNQYTYQWFKNENAVGDAAADSLVVSDAGTYRVFVSIIYMNLIFQMHALWKLTSCQFHLKTTIQPLYREQWLRCCLL